MRLHIVSILLIVALMTSGAQDSTAEASPPPSDWSAYDILGVSPYLDGVVRNPEAIVTEETPRELALGDSSGNDNVAVPEEDPIVEPISTEPISTELAEPEIEATASVLPDPASTDLDEQDMDEAETILMAEIARLMAERDSLYQEIIALRAENEALTAQVVDLAYYKNRSEELASEISRLESELVEKETALAAADTRLAEVEERLLEEGERLASSEQARFAAEESLADALAALEAARATGAVVSGAASPSTGYLAGWSLDTSRFKTKLRDGFDGSVSRMGSWRIKGATAAQTDASQYFSRLELPLAQGKATTLYRFTTRSSGTGWVGIGLHLYVENVRKKYGYGEGRSLLVWFTRDRAARGDDATYLQLYRSDDDVVMERMFDAELRDGLEVPRVVEVVYDPVAEYIAISVDGVLRIVYKTFFGRDSGATVSLRTLGGGGSFSDFSVWSE